MMMGPSEGIGSPSSLLLNKVQLDALGALGRNWEFLNQEKLGISGDWSSWSESRGLGSHPIELYLSMLLL